MGLQDQLDPVQGAARTYAAQLLREAELYGVTLALPAETTDWNEIFTAEAKLLSELKDPDLRRRAWLVYDRYAEVAGAEKAARRASANASRPDDCAFEILKADLLQIHNETGRIYMLGYQIERERAVLTRFVRSIGVWALAALLAFFSVLWLIQQLRKRGYLDTPAVQSSAGSETGTPKKDPDLIIVPIVPLVVIVGMLGASFSVLQRVQRSTANDPLMELFALRAARSQVPLAILSGAIAALVIFAIFCGGMLEGGLFPKIVNTKSPAQDASPMMELMYFLNHTGPLRHVDYGKLLVWAFVAGFAERLVPDILDKFTASAKK